MNKECNRATGVRFATVDDASRIGEIHVVGWRAAYRGIVPDNVLAGLSAAKRAAGWKYAIEQDPRGVFVFERAGAILGWTAVATSREGIPDAGEILALYVDPGAWREGCGRSLMDAAETELWHRGYLLSVLWVLEKNVRARGFYGALGYHEDGGRKTSQAGEAELIELRLAKAAPVVGTSRTVRNQ